MQRRIHEEGSALIISLLLMILLFSLGAALLSVAESETVIAGNDQWSEGAFLAAEAAVQLGINQLGPGTTGQTVPEAQLSEQYSYRSGKREDAAAQPPELVGSVPGPGYAVGSGTGYSSSGYVFQVYAVSGTGMGPRNAIREVEVQVEIGPVSQ